MRWQWLASMFVLMFAAVQVLAQTGTTVAFYSQVPTVADAAALAALPCSATVNTTQERIQEDTDEKYNCRDPGGGFAWRLVSPASGGVSGLTEGAVQFGSSTGGLDESPSLFNFFTGTLTVGEAVVVPEGVARIGNFLEIGDEALWIEPDGDVGIGTDVPLALFHIKAGDSGESPNSFVDLLIEDVTGAVLGLSVNVGGFSAIMFGRKPVPLDGGIFYGSLHARGFDWRVNGGAIAMDLDEVGNLKITGSIDADGCIKHGALATAPAGTECDEYYDTDNKSPCFHDGTQFVEFGDKTTVCA